MIKSKRVRQAGHVVRMEEGRTAFKIVTGRSSRRRIYEDLGVDGWRISEWILEK